MLMNPEDFEHRLKRQPFRQVPPEWRSEVLSNAHHASRLAPRVSSWRAILSTFTSQLSILLWPAPKAWAGLAAIWLLLLIVNRSTTDKSYAAAGALSRPAPERIMAWREQERLLTELLGPQEISVVEKPKPIAPRPRSERHNQFLII